MQETVYQLNTPLSMALITDLHELSGEEVLSSLREHKPSILCIAGDLIYGSLPRNRQQLKLEAAGVLPFLRSCAALAPTYFSLGNHEWMLCDGDMALISETGVQLLDNSWIEYEGLSIGGLSSARCTKYQAYRSSLHGVENYPYNGDRYLHAAPDTAWLDAFERAPGYKLLLCHHPEYYPRYLAGRNIDLIVSGHAHGGQIRLFGRGLFAPGQGLFPQYTSGVHDERLVISRGLANNTVIPRLFNPPELVYIVPKE